MKDFVQAFRSEQLIYDVEKKNGIVFVLPDILQCGMLGLCFMSTESIQDLMKFVDKSMNLIKSFITNYENKNAFSNTKYDTIEFNEIFGRIKMFNKYLNKVK